MQHNQCAVLQSQTSRHGGSPSEGLCEERRCFLNQTEERTSCSTFSPEDLSAQFLPSATPSANPSPDPICTFGYPQFTAAGG